MIPTTQEPKHITKKYGYEKCIFCGMSTDRICMRPYAPVCYVCENKYSVDDLEAKLKERKQQILKDSKDNK